MGFFLRETRSLKYDSGLLMTRSPNRTFSSPRELQKYLRPTDTANRRCKYCANKQSYRIVQTARYSIIPKRFYDRTNPHLTAGAGQDQHNRFFRPLSIFSICIAGTMPRMAFHVLPLPPPRVPPALRAKHIPRQVHLF